MRNTKQKKIIFDIVNNSCIHPNAYQIYEIAKKSISDISLGTIYRNLNNLVDEFQIKRIKMPDNIDRYDKMLKHSHFVCINCMDIIDINEQILKNIDSINGNKVIDCEVIIKGVCKKCLEKGK